MVNFNKYVEIGPATMTADAVARGMVKAAERDKKIIAVLEDMGFPGMAWFKKNAPERVVECGIAEAGAAVVAAGLAAEGFTPVIYSFVFAAIGRAYNQIRQSILVDRFNVKIIGREGAWGETGISHNYVEGIAATRVMPNLVILSPADVVESEKATVAMMQYVGPVFLRLEASPPPLKIFSEDYPFDIGKAYTIKDGKDATIIATGYMVTEAISAAELLEKDGIDIRIVNMSTLKPLDVDAVIEAAQTTGAIVTAENHSVIGGLGEAVGVTLAEYAPVPLVRVGIQDEFSQSGKITKERDELKIHFELDAKDLAVAVKECLAKKERLQAAGRKGSG
ncbi:MAG: transketolase family protein [Chloroflexi bacterium]|nr:transketolase family protein [Chloroflexota bacterium]